VPVTADRRCGGSLAKEFLSSTEFGREPRSGGEARIGMTPERKAQKAAR
jgi:hypothetical protein